MSEGQALGGSAAQPGDAYKWYVLLLLFLVFICSYVDRTIMSILQLPIQRELGLSDTQLGLLNGIAFTLCYALVAVPVGRLADRRSRRLILAAILAVWSVSTVLCGFATGFAFLFLCRIGVATGEGGCMPVSMSLISDYFPQSQRATAIALWTLSVPLGSMIGYASGGWLNAAIGWRHSFLAVGAFGLLLLPVVLITLRDPVRGGLDGSPAGEQPRLADALAFIWRLRSLRYQVVGSAMQIGILNVFLTWNVPFFVRTHAQSIGDAAFSMALAIGLGGMVGSFGGGALTDRLSRRDIRWYSWLPATTIALLLPIGLLQLFSPSLPVALCAAFVVSLLNQTYLAPTMALGQTLVPPRMRGFTSAVQAIMTLLLAGALAPVVAGWLSDWWAPLYGAMSLRHAMAALLVLSPVGMIAYLSASRHVRAEWSRARLA